MPSAKATAIFDGNDAALQKTIKGIGKSLGAMQKKFREGAGQLGAGALSIAQKGVAALGVAGVAAGVGLAIGVKHAYDLGSELQDMHDKTGMAVDQLMILNQAGKDNGLDDLSGAVAKMQKNLIAAVRDGASPAGRALATLGLDATTLARQLPTDELQQIGERINAIQNPALKTATAMEIFGKAGATLLPLFADRGALGTAAASIGRQALILRDNAARFDAVSDRLGRTGLKLQGFFVGVAEKVLPYMEAVTEKLDGLDLAGQGEKFGDGIKVAVDFLAGSFANPQALFGTAVNFLKAGVLETGNLLIMGFRTAVNILSSPSFWQGLEGYGDILIAGLIKGFNTATDVLAAGLEMILEKLPEAMGGKQTATAKRKDLEEERDRLNSRLNDKGAPAFQMFTGQGGSVTIPSREPAPAAERRESIERLRKNLKETAALGSDDSFASRMKRAHAQGGTGLDEMASDLTQSGKAKIKAGLTGVTEGIASGRLIAPHADVLGAAQPLAAGVAGFHAAAAQGNAILAPLTQQPSTAALSKDPWARFAGFATASHGGLLDSGGLSGASMAGNLIGANRMQGPMRDGASLGSRSQLVFNTSDMSKAHGASPLLGHAERRAFENSMVAAGGKRHASSPGAYGAVAHGDAKRRKNAAKEEERKKQADLASGQAQLTELQKLNDTVKKGLLGEGES